MILITSTLHTRPGQRERALELALAHSERSRTEPGCIQHDVFLHPTDGDALFFYEQWADQQSIDDHFRKQTSIAFVASLAPLAADPLSLTITPTGPSEVREVAL